MTDTDIDDLLAYVRQAEATVQGSKGPSQDQKTEALRRARWRKVKSGKSPRWESPDGTFVGSAHECFRELQRLGRMAR
jgi:hypothetical protein